MRSAAQTLRGATRGTVLPFLLALLVIAGLLGMHATVTSSQMADAGSVSVMEMGAASPGETTGGHDCPNCAGEDSSAGVMVLCGMVLLAGIALAVAATPRLTGLLVPPLRILEVRPVVAVDALRPSLVALSISRT